ncbi:2-dehydro-3-deoxygalactonokinase [Leeia oryzae]|uniref:2-dehydro-3-deoxygalactonokinase n=1 Tax=Leeia oryzae TaxID=356662 RepID=UPI00037FEF63|nr:2-dehydro-3-deoxygalactonokinase [Leeia oryzae]
MSTALIGIDWGSTHARAFRYDRSGQCIETRRSDAGITRCPAGSIPGILLDELTDWLAAAPDVPLLVCGMAGSAVGWQEVPYVQAPVGLSGLVDGLRVFAYAGRQVGIVPGVAGFCDKAGFTDVMRGEETQFVGLSDTLPVLIAPGTHSKWIEGGPDGITALHTFMTGEMYALLRQHSLVGRVCADADWDEAAFQEGLSVASVHPDWLNQLFGVRARGVLGERTPAALSSWLSGLLIGYEMVQGLQRLAGKPAQVGVVASGQLTGPYLAALACFGVQGIAIDGEQAVTRGLWQIAKKAGWV